jgi:hypothetical protein
MNNLFGDKGRVTFAPNRLKCRRAGQGARVAGLFLSYKTEDRPRAAHLVAALRAAGLETWWDQDIPAGGGWRETIAAQLDQADLCIVAWSEASAGPEGRYVREEAERAAARGAYLGVLIDPVAPPFGFAEWQAVDLSDWDGTASDPLLGYFVDQMRARLEGRPPPPAPPRKPRRARSLKLPIALGAAVAAAGAGALAFFLLARPESAPAAETPTAFVNSRLDRAACSWLQIANVAPAQGGERIALTGIAAAPDAVQASLMRDALAAAVPIAEIAVDDVATGPGETCAELELLRQYPWRGRPRLAVVQPRGSLERTPYGWSIRFEFEVDYHGLPAQAALLGLDSIGGVEMLIPDLHAFRRQHAPLRVDGERATYESRFYDENQGARNVGLVLMTASAPIDPALVGAIGSRGDRDFLARFGREAQAGRWQFELALVPCGFDGSITRRQC